METAHAPNRQSDILPLINQLKFDPVKSETDRIYNSAANMTTSALVSPTNMYPGPPPPYSYPATTPTSSHPISGLISPPESRRTSDDQDPPPNLPQQRQSLPSIHEALGAPSVSAPPYQPQPTAPAPAPMSNPFAAPPSSIPRSQAPFDSAPNLQRTSPPQPIHPQHRSYIRNESAASNLPPPQAPYPEPSRHQSMPSIHSSQPPPQHRMQPAYVEQPRYDNDPRAFDSGNRMNGYPPQQQQQQQQHSPYGYQPSQMPMAPAPYPNQYPPQRPYQNSRYGLEHAEEHAKFGEPASMRKTYAPVVKRHLDTFEIEISLAEISASSNELVNFSAHYHRLAQETQRSAQTPDRMPTLGEVENMLVNSEKTNNALQRMRNAVMEQQHIHADQMARDQGKGIDYDGDDGSMYSEDLKGNGYGGSDAKKRRGRAAPPGRCHSCNRAETPEWRRGPDGARTLCNACGLHYAKLTRKMGGGGGQKSNGIGGQSSTLRPKSMGSNSPL